MIRTRVLRGVGDQVDSGMPVGETSRHSYFLAAKEGPDDLSDNDPTGACGYGRVLLPGHPMRERPQVFMGRLRGYGDYGLEPLVSAEETARQEAAIGDITKLGGNLRDTAMENIERWGPSVEKFANGIAAANAGDAETAMTEMSDAVATAVSMVGPVGAILGTLLRIWSRVASWLAREYPAMQVCCGDKVDKQLPSKLGWPAGEDGYLEFYKNLRMLYVYSTYSRATTSDSFRRYSDCVPSIGADFLAGSMENKWATLAKVCQPVYSYAGEVPPGWKRWIQWERDPTIAPTLQPIKDAQAAIGESVLARLMSQGSASYFEFNMNVDAAFGATNLCKVGGFTFTVEGLPDTTLLDLIRGLAGLSVTDDVRAQVDEVVAREPLAIPGVPEGSARIWRDGLAQAILTCIEPSGQKTYHLNALLSEYKRRVDAGILPRVRTVRFAAARPTKTMTVKMQPRGGAANTENITIGGKTAQATVTSEKPLSFSSAATFPVGASLAAVIRGRKYVCDCTREGADVRCKCK